MSAGGACTTAADCCIGECYLAPGSTDGTCQPTGDTGAGGGGVGGGGVGGGGTGGFGPTCSEYGQACTDAGDCCNQVPCNDGFCRYITPN